MEGKIKELKKQMKKDHIEIEKYKELARSISHIPINENVECMTLIYDEKNDETLFMKVNDLVEQYNACREQMLYYYAILKRKGVSYEDAFAIYDEEKIRKKYGENVLTSAYEMNEILIKLDGFIYAIEHLGDC